MVYTVVEIVFVLVVAAFLGLVLGWLLRGKSIRERLESQWRRLVDDERNNLRQAGERLKRVGAENEALADKTKGLEAKLATLEPLASEHAKLSAERAELQGQVDRLSPLEAQNAELEAQLDTLRSRLSELESVQGENADLKTTIKAQQARVDALEPLQAELAGLTDKLAAAQSDLDELRPLREKAQGLHDTVESLQTSLAQAEARASSHTATPELATEAPPEEPQEAPSEDDLHAQIKQIAERTSGGEPPADDDLKRIKGVGPVIERLLKEMGITSYRQIANCTEKDIDLVTAAMDSFRGRIQRDGWIEGAREEYRKKYGADA